MYLAHGTTVEWSVDDTSNLVPGSYQPTVTAKYSPNSQQIIWKVRLAPELPGTENGYFQSMQTFEIILDTHNFLKKQFLRALFSNYQSIS